MNLRDTQCGIRKRGRVARLFRLLARLSLASLLILAVHAVFASSAIDSRDPVISVDAEEPINISSQVRVHWDQPSPADINRFLATQPEFSQPDSSPVTYFGPKPKFLWVKVTLANPTDHAINRLLYIQNPRIDKLEFHYQVDDTWVRVQTGNKIPIELKSHPSFPVLRLTLPPFAVKTIYISSLADFRFSLPVIVSPEAAFERMERRHISVGMVMMTSLVIICISQIFFFFALSNKDFLVFAALVTFTILMSLNAWGTLPRLIPALALIHDWLNIGFSTLSIFVSVYFVYLFLDIKHQSRFLSRYTFVLMIALVLNLLLGFVASKHDTFAITSFLAVVTLLYHISASGYCLYKGNRLSLLFIVAAIGVHGGFLIYELGVLNIIGIGPSGALSLFIGALWESIIIMFALVYRIRQVRQEKQIANDLLIKQAENKSQSLEREMLRQHSALESIGEDYRELDASRQRLVMTMKRNRVTVWRYLYSTGKLDVDEAFLRSYGYELNEFGSYLDALKAIVDPEDLRTLIFIYDSIETSQSNDLFTEIRVKSKAGPWRQLYIRAQLVITARDEKMLVGVAIDITDIRRVEMAFQQTKEKYEHLFEYAPVALLETDLETGQIFECNERFCALFGFESKTEAIGEKWDESFFADPSVKDDMTTSLKDKGRFGDVQSQFRRKNGETFWGQISFRWIPDQGYVGGMIIDISKQVSAEAALRESETRFRDLVENSPIGICIQVDGRIGFMNPAQRELFGGGAFPERFEDIKVHSGDMATFRKFLDTMNAHEVIKEDIELRIYPSLEAESRGEYKNISIRMRPIEFFGAKASLINMADISYARKLEQINRTRDKMVSLGHISMGIAHEIRSPLSGINLLLDAIREEIEFEGGAEELSEMLREIQKASSKISTVVKQVLDFSKPSEPKLKLSDITQPIQDAIKLTTTTLRKSDIHLETELSPDLPQVMIDAQLIEQVMINLINNSIQILEPLDIKKVIKISMERLFDQLHITVADSGPGVSDEIVGKIFEPFFTTKGSGSGIGLSICQRIINDHNGTINVSNGSLGGAEFVIRLPVGEVDLN